MLVAFQSLLQPEQTMARLAARAWCRLSAKHALHTRTMPTAQQHGIWLALTPPAGLQICGLSHRSCETSSQLCSSAHLAKLAVHMEGDSHQQLHEGFLPSRLSLQGWAEQRERQRFCLLLALLLLLLLLTDE